MKSYKMEWKSVAGHGTLLFESEYRKGTRRNREDAIHALYSKLGWAGTQLLEILSINICNR